MALSVLAALSLGTVANWYETVSMGVILGLSAAGLYDGARAIGGSKADVVVVQEDPSTKP